MNGVQKLTAGSSSKWIDKKRATTTSNPMIDWTNPSYSSATSLLFISFPLIINTMHEFVCPDNGWHKAESEVGTVEWEVI